jgi:hypothetical protein
MAKIAVIVLADTETHGDLGRIANALTTVSESKEAGDAVELIFDGAGTKWVPELSKADHKLHPAFDNVRDKVAGACEFCAGAFGVKEQVRAVDVPLLDEYHDHPSLRKRVAEGFEVITF